jgi:hypothetical protein
MMYQGRFISYNRGTSAAENVDNEGAVHASGWVYGKCLCCMPNFAMNLKLLFKKILYKKRQQTRVKQSCSISHSTKEESPYNK